MRRSKREVPEQSLILLRTGDLPEAHQAITAVEERGGQCLHVYGPRVVIGDVPAKAEERVSAAADVRSLTTEAVSRAPESLSEVEQLGLEAWNLRHSPEFIEAKAYRPRDGERWDMEDVTEPPDGRGMQHTGESDVLGAVALAPEDMSPYLIGSVAVGIILVEGPTAALQFTAQERAKVVAEVQEGLTWLGTREPKASVTWAYDIHTVRVNVQPNLNLTGFEPLESRWRNPAMGQLGFSQNFQGVRDYVASIRTQLGTRWGYVGFFTKYPVHHFAYASKPRLVMHFQNDGWGPDNIDRVFTHETGHIFGCPDEYSASNCNCTARFGFLQEVNGNCQLCASPFVQCLMAANTWAMCSFTPTHLGWRDSDNDGTLDPVDPLANPLVDLNRICRRFPSLCELIRPLGMATVADLSPHESIPLFLLRRVLTAEEMARVQSAVAREEDQYLEAIVKKLGAVTDEIRRQSATQAPRQSGRRKR